MRSRRGRLLLAFVVSVLCALAWLWSAGTFDQASQAAPAPHVPGGTPVLASAPTAEPVERQVLPPAGATGTAAATAPDVVFTGRCIAAEDGQPLAGVIVSFARTTRLQHEVALAELAGTYREPEPVATASDREGRFELAARYARGWLLSLSFAAPHRVRVEGNASSRGRVDLGDIPLMTAVAASARVVDNEGTPQPDLRVTLTGPATERIKGWLGAQDSLDLVSQADGSVPLPALLPGRWSVICRDCEVIGSKEWDVTGSAPPFDIVVDTHPESISGAVVDPRGLPVAGVAVQIAQRGEYWGGVPMSCAEGRFRVRRWSTDRPAPQRLELTKPGYRTLQTEPMAWGTAGLRLELSPARELEVLAVDDATGAAVETFGVRILWSNSVKTDWRSNCGALTHVGRHPGGRVRITLDDGPHRLYVQPASTGHAAAGPIDLVAGESMQGQVVLRLARLQQRTVQVVNAAGSAIEGSKVELLRPGSDGSAVLDLNQAIWRMPWGKDRNATLPLRLMQELSDRDGKVAMNVLLSETLELRVSGPAHCPFTRQVVFAAEPDPLPVVVAVGAAVNGSIEPREYGARVGELSIASANHPGAPAIQLVQDGEPPLRRFPDKPVALSPEGRFRLEHVPPGTWEVVAVAWLGGPSMYSQLQQPLGSTILVEGQQQDLRLDVQARMPATLQGRVVVNGAPWVDQNVMVRFEYDVPMLRDRRGPGGVGMKTDAEGNFTCHRLPGRYRVAVNGIEAPELVRLAPGATTEATFTVTSGTVLLTFVDERSAPVPGACGVVIGADDTVLEVIADKAGQIRLHRVPGPLMAGVLPAGLRDNTARSKWLEQQGDRSRALRAAALGVVPGEAVTGAEAMLRITVPATAGY